jgi:hypothetical protein
MARFIWVAAAALTFVSVMYVFDLRRGDRHALLKAVLLAGVMAVAGALVVMNGPK